MDALIDVIQNHIEYAPIIIFGVLLLAGLNIPISEDGMLFIAASLATTNPEILLDLFLAVYLGAYFSDLICYGLGRLLGPKILQIKFFARMLSQDKIDKIHDYYQRYGILTLIFGRLIPFGVRNGLFLTAGIGKMSATKFACSDLFACTISTVSFFWLYYHYGTAVIEYVMEFNIVIFILALSVAGYIYLRKGKY
jgi:membrane protein DedA with SNARE-associated domain